MGEHGVSWENMENTEKMEKVKDINQMTKNSLFMIQNTHFGNPMTLYFMAFMSTVEIS